MYLLNLQDANQMYLSLQSNNKCFIMYFLYFNSFLFLLYILNLLIHFNNINEVIFIDIHYLPFFQSSLLQFHGNIFYQ